MEPGTVLIKNPDVVARELAEPGRAVLLNLESGAYHGLNPVGLLVWERIDGERTVQDLIDGVREQVAEPPDSLPADVIGFLESALQRDLVRDTGDAT